MAGVTLSRISSELWRYPQIVLEGVDIFGAELSGEKCSVVAQLLPSVF